MKYLEYREKAHEFANYEDENYPYFGIIEEVGEIFGKLAKSMRGDKKLDNVEVCKEFGDVLWMTNEIAIKHNITISEEPFCTASKPKFNPVFRSLVRVLSGANALVNGRLFSDQNFWIVVHDRQSYINIIYTNLAFLAVYYDSTIEEIMDYNIKKLTARKEQNLINGDGDNREVNQFNNACGSVILNQGISVVRPQNISF